MSDYSNQLRDYEYDAEDRYDSYYPDEMYEDDYDSGLEGYEEDYYEDDYIPAMGDYDSYVASSIGRIDPNDRTLTVVVTNTSGADATAILFGANESAAQPAGVSVVVQESSHEEVRRESISNVFKIRGMKMSVSDPLQFDSVINIVRRTATGSNESRVYQPRNATSPQNFTQQLIDDDNFEMDVTGQDSLRTVVRDGATIVFTFTIKARANMGNVLRGGNVAEVSNAPRTTGLPQLDLLRKRQPHPLGISRRSMKGGSRRPPMKPRRPPMRTRPMLVRRSA